MGPMEASPVSEVISRQVRGSRLPSVYSLCEDHDAHLRRAQVPGVEDPAPSPRRPRRFAALPTGTRTSAQPSPTFPDAGAIVRGRSRSVAGRGRAPRADCGPFRRCGPSHGFLAASRTGCSIVLGLSERGCAAGHRDDREFFWGALARHQLRREEVKPSPILAGYPDTDSVRIGASSKGPRPSPARPATLLDRG